MQSSNSSSPIIELLQVTKRYGQRLALDQVDFVMRPGVTGLLGPNGSGKSTLIKALMGLVRTTTGSGHVLGLAWPDEVRQIRERIGYLPEDDCYVEGLQGVESVKMMARLSGLHSSEALRRAHEVLDFCDVGQERYRQVETYSTGMRQKLKFAQALVHDPQLIILDEPTTGLDPTQREEFLNRIATLAHKHNKSILLSTHILHDVRQVCDQVVILVKGRVRVAESLELLSRPAHPGLQLRTYEKADLLAKRMREASLEVEELPGQVLAVRGLAAGETGQIWKWCSELGIALQSVEPARNSLEQLFLEVVKEAEHAGS